MDRRKSGARDHDAPRKPRRKAKKNGGAAIVILTALGVVALLGAGGAVGAVLYLKSARPSGADGPAKHADPGAKLAEMGDRFLGSWEGESPERPSLKVYLEVTRDRVALKAFNVRVNEWGDPRVYSWRPVRAEGNALIVFREEVVGEKYQLEWTVVFASDDAMSVSSRDSGRLIANFRRVGKK
jgi:hypothetical protein